MGVGFIGSNKELVEMARKEGHPNPKAVKSLGELINWVTDKANQKKVKTRRK